jgi:hypothetical protein
LARLRRAFSALAAHLLAAHPTGKDARR